MSLPIRVVVFSVEWSGSAGLLGYRKKTSKCCCCCTHIHKLATFVCLCVYVCVRVCVCQYA